MSSGSAITAASSTGAGSSSVRGATTLHTGETRTYLADGDEVIFRAHCRRDGYVPIGFGECRARVVA